MNTTEDLTVFLTSPLFWGLAIVGVLLTGISKSGFAGGAGVIAVPLLSLLIPVPVAAALMLPLLIVMDAKSMHYYWRSVRWQELKVIAPAGLIGIIAGGFLLGELPSSLLQLLLGLFCIVFSLWQKLTPLLGRLPYAGFIWGAVSGLTSTLLHSGGPPINIYLATRQLPKRNWLATAAVFFAMMNIIKIIPYALTGQWQFDSTLPSSTLPTLLLIDIILLPVSLIGVWLGYRLHSKISEAHFMTACKGLLFFSGLGLLSSAMLSA
ncbi:MAG: sulfite exporter TauE/SafE family protein [Oleispira sp.]|nr:sulfite exporter TauE/SafE family protein [Oleispira sp.]